MFKYTHYIYYLQKEWTRFGLKVSVVYRVLAHSEPKIHKDFSVPNYSNIPNTYIIHKKNQHNLAQKSDKIHKGF